MLNKIAEAAARVMYLYGLSKHANPAEELHGIITPAEAIWISHYSKMKGLYGLEPDMISDEPKTLLDYLFDIDVLNRADPKKASTPLSVKAIKKELVEPAFYDNDRLDPEELVQTRGTLSLEGHMTETNLSNYYSVIEGFTKDRKIFLMVHGDDVAIAYYINGLQEAKFHTQSLHRNRNGTFSVKDQNERERPNLMVVAPLSYIKEEFEKIKGELFGGLDREGSNMPRLAIEVERNDTPQMYGVHAVLHRGAKMPAMIEMISHLYNITYLKQRGSGVQNGR